MKRTTRTAEDLRSLAAVARGDRPADLYLEGGRVLNVYSGEALEANVAVARGRVAYVGGDRRMVGQATRIVSVADRVLVPGYVDPHAHPLAIYNPVTLAAAILPLGTTAAVGDTIWALAHGGHERAADLLTRLSGLPFRYYWFLRLSGQGPHPEEAELFALDRLQPLLHLEPVRAAGEVTRWPALYAGEPALTEAVAAALAAGRRVEGHAPGVSADRVQALAAAGISSEHEAISAAQALDRLRAGLYVMLRHSSIRRDIPALASVATGARAFSGRLMLTPDGPAATFVAEEGYMDYLIRVAIEAGVDPIAAYQMVTVNPATYYGLDEDLGGIAPGRWADINVLRGLEEPRPEVVFVAGELAAEAGRLRISIPDLDWETFIPRQYAPTWRPAPEHFSTPSRGTIPTLHLENAVITRRVDVTLTEGRLPPGVQRVALCDPDGRGISPGLISGFADRLGGLASTFTVSGGLVVIGDDPHACALAAARALDLGGGIVLAEGGALLGELALPIAGMASREPLLAVAQDMRRLTDLLRMRGYRHDDLGYTLLFLAFDSLPDIRLTTRGVWDVKAQAVLLPRRNLPG